MLDSTREAALWRQSFEATSECIVDEPMLINKGLQAMP